MYQKILVVIDKEADNDAVFKQGVALAKLTGASLMLLHVLSPQAQDAPASPASDSIFDVTHAAALQGYLQQWQAYEQAGLDLLKTLADQATAEGVTTEFSLNRGDLGRMICDLAHNWNADLILMAGRKQNGLMGLILGSVSNYVTHHAPCSVLLIQPL
jgi:nucleotide-binding universal stress UspA family protein